MNGLRVRTIWNLAAAFGLAAAFWTGSAGATTMTLDCPGSHLTAMVDAAGQFRFPNVPEGVCRLGVTAPEAGLATEGVTTAREAGSGMATGKRQHQPIRCAVSLDGVPAASQTMACDDWSKSPVSFTVAGKPRQYTGHVTLMK